MAHVFQITVQYLCLAFLAALATACALVGLKKVGKCLYTRLSPASLVVLALAAVITICEAQKRGDSGATGDSPAPVQQTGTTGDPPVEDITDTFHFSAISVPTSGTVALTTAWTNGLLTAGQTIDILAKTDLRDERWAWLTNGVVEAGATNMSWTIENQSPSNSFYKAVVRDTLTDMDDPDGDGLPNAYELAYGRNPWVRDYALVQKLTVGPNGDFGDIVSALAASEEYSIIAVTSGVHQVNHGVQMPPHPVMVTCDDGYAVFSGSSPNAMFLLGNGHQSGHTLFRNLYLNLTSTSGMQAGVWCGGGLPWAVPGAAAVFENVHIRAPNPGVEYFGWLFYAPCDAPAVIRGCCVNASGAEWIYAIFGDNPPPIVVESCTFVNFPTQSVYQSTAIGLRSTHANGAITSTPPVALSRVLFDASFTNAWPLARFENAGDFPVTMTDCIRPSEPISSDFMADVTNNVHITTSLVAWAGFPLAGSPAAVLGIGAFAPIPSDLLDDTDHDTLLDYDEVYDRGMDPFLADTDGDGIPDDVEILVHHTDPTDPHSFKQNLTVTVTNKDSTASAVYTAWDTSEAGWAPNGLAAFPEGFGTTNYIDASSQGATHVKAFCDLNGNGTFDAEYDILRVRPIPLGSTAQVNFVFGDVDGDGVSDSQERQQGTNPYDDNNFKFAATVKIESSDVAPGLTNFVAWSYSAAGWEPNDLARFAGKSLTFPINAPVMGGELFVKVFRDLNTNGVYDVDVDALVSNRLTWAHNGKTVTFNIGDSDGDKIPDSVELAENTNPLDIHNYCFNLSLTYTGVFQTTNALTFAASFGTDRVYGPCVVEGSVWTNDFGHRATTTGERVSVDVWDDANQNGDWDVGETSNKYVIAVTGHDMVVTNTLSYLNFDRNNNEIPDWWDAQNGLDAEGVAYRAYDDPDGDGLINLHEFWADCNPLVPDGSNTLLSVTARAVDEGIRDRNPTNSICKFFNYETNGINGVFIPSTNFWAFGIDTSCASMWNDARNDLWGGGCNGWNMAGTLISARHLIYAHHYAIPHGTTLYFMDGASNVYSRTLIDSRYVSCDIRIGLLNSDLPSTLHPAKILPPEYGNYIGTAKRLPCVTFDQEEKLTVAELSDLKCFNERTSLSSAQRPHSDMRRAFYEDMIPGDSGSPRFLLVDQELVLLCVMWKGGGGSGCFITHFIDEIQASMDNLANGYHLQFINLDVYQRILTTRR